MLCVALCCVLRYVVCCLLCTTRTSRYDAFQKNCELELRGSANNCVWCVDFSGGTSAPRLLLAADGTSAPRVLRAGLLRSGLLRSSDVCYVLLKLLVLNVRTIVCVVLSGPSLRSYCGKSHYYYHRQHAVLLSLPHLARCLFTVLLSNLHWGAYNWIPHPCACSTQLRESNTLPLLLLFLCFVLLRYVLLVLLGMTRFKRTASSNCCMLDWPALCVQVNSIKPPSPCCCKFLLRSGLRVCVFFSSRWQCEVWRGPNVWMDFWPA